MIKIEDKSKCCGCWACSNICPKKCITMQEDAEGFRYPSVDNKLCIECGLCIKVCPQLHKESSDQKPLSFIIQQKNSDILRHSTSGGFFSAISKYAIKNKGVVFGAAFNKQMELYHQYSETLEGCAKFRGSKYVQSIIGTSFQQAKNFLDKGRIVVFSGTPCQIAGLHYYLKQKEYSNLITVDLVCHGVPSPLLQKKYFEYHTLKSNSKIINYLSRDKYYGYNFSTATIQFENPNIQYHKGMEADIMLRLYFKNICSRPCCYSCHFKTLHRVSDFTIFDCWDARSTAKFFNKHGATNVLIHSKKGQNIFEVIKQDFKYAASNLEKTINTDGDMILKSVPKNPYRENFFKDLNSLDFEETIHKYLGNSKVKALIAYLKPLLYRIGVFNLYMRIKSLKKVQ